ncbi:retrovirus-related Pol polyprotein from transposon 412 [Nephila pilipes]|uniref:Retrovirus-related Pol polyprotein from transposon 412 n=1 Tax=Nephila pilipes TaxID=299642 RepID=A0A8X6T5T6_NEPPI|nr:retrovirus-related Pol polyprotein from transposon 412 [Nephila pilipes]
MTMKTIAGTLIHGRISRFGCPVTITTDPFTNFQSNLFRELTRMLVYNKNRRAAYHTQANGIIVRLHCYLKSALKARNQFKWTEILPTVLLALRSALKEDIMVTCSLLAYGTTLRLTYDLVASGSIDQNPNSTYVTNLIQAIRSLNPVSTAHHSSSKTCVNLSLKIYSHIFLGPDKVNSPLAPSYTVPHLVISRTDKNFTIDLNGKQNTVAIDHIKFAYLLVKDTNTNNSEYRPSVEQSPTASSNPVK